MNRRDELAPFRALLAQAHARAQAARAAGDLVTAGRHVRIRQWLLDAAQRWRARCWLIEHGHGDLLAAAGDARQDEGLIA